MPGTPSSRHVSAVGEDVDDFALRLNTLMQQLARYGVNDIVEERAVEKFLRVVPKKYSQVAIAIEEVTGRQQRAATSLRAGHHRWQASLHRGAVARPPAGAKEGGGIELVEQLQALAAQAGQGTWWCS